MLGIDDADRNLFARRKVAHVDRKDIVALLLQQRRTLALVDGRPNSPAALVSAPEKSEELLLSTPQQKFPPAEILVLNPLDDSGYSGKPE